MHAALITGLRRLDLVEVPEPQPGPGAAVVEIGLCGVCGTDVAAYRSGNPYPPFLCGHEWCGTVTANGHGVGHVREGDRVVMGVPVACGACGPCRAGVAHRCQQLLALAFGQHPLTPAHGGYAPRIAVPAESLVLIPPGLPDEQAAQVEPATVALHAVRRRSPRLGDTVVVLGAGPIGLFTVQLARAAGAGRLLVVEPRSRRRSLAVELGADAALESVDELDGVLRDATSGLGADLVYDCAGTPVSLTSALLLVRAGGVVMMTGSASEPISLDPGLWLAKEVTIDTSLAHQRHEFDITLDLLAGGRLQVAPLHDLTVGLGSLAGALSDLADGADLVKVLVDPRSAAG